MRTENMQHSAWYVGKINIFAIIFICRKTLYIVTTIVVYVFGENKISSGDMRKGCGLEQSSMIQADFMQMCCNWEGGACLVQVAHSAYSLEREKAKQMAW